MEHEMGLRPHQLGMMALCQGVACAVTGPLWGNLVDSGASRKLLLKVRPLDVFFDFGGCAMWSGGCRIVGTVHSSTGETWLGHCWACDTWKVRTLRCLRFTSAVWEMMLLRVLNGAALSMLWPVVQSFIAVRGLDSFEQQPFLCCPSTHART